MGFQQRRTAHLVYPPAAAAATTKNYYTGGRMNSGRLTRGFGWLALVLTLLGLGS